MQGAIKVLGFTLTLPATAAQHTRPVFTWITLLYFVFLEVTIKKRLLCAGIVFIWIFNPVYQTIIGVLITDIIEGTCVPWGIYSSYAAKKTVAFSVLFFAYLLPLMAMLFCYYRIVYTIKHKVSPTL